MIFVRIIQVISLLVFTGVTVWGLRMTVWSEQMVAGVNTEDTGFQFEMPKMPWFLRQITQQNPDVPLEKGVIRRVTTDIGGAVEGKKNELLFRPDDLNVTRGIKIEQVLPLSAFLEEGEETPPPALQSLYVRARAARMLAPYCREMLGILAKGCAYRSSSITGPKDGLYRVSVTFAYVPAYDLGAFSAQRGYEELSAVVRLTKDRGGQIVNTAEARKSLYYKALAVCDEFRKKYPNCVLERVYLDIVPKLQAKPKKQRRKSKVEKKKSLLKKAKRFGEKGAFGGKGGFGNKSGAQKKNGSSAPVDLRYSNETVTARVVVGVYALDTRDEDKLVREMGKTVSEKLVQ